MTAQVGGEVVAGTAVYCDHCGEPLDTGVHDGCARLRRLEPPRYCPHCRRRMAVQVTPRGWTARCVEHGETTDAPKPETGGGPGTGDPG